VITLKKVDKSVADAYYKTRTRHITIYLTIWAIVSFGVVAFAQPLSGFTVNGMPFHYFMGAQGSIVTFIILLFVNAIVSDKVDKKFGIDEAENVRLSAGKSSDH
jgi:putative solute:sodium symporter small subunit